MFYKNIKVHSVILLSIGYLGTWFYFQWPFISLLITPLFYLLIQPEGNIFLTLERIDYCLGVLFKPILFICNHDEEAQYDLNFTFPSNLFFLILFFMLLELMHLSFLLMLLPILIIPTVTRNILFKSCFEIILISKWVTQFSMYSVYQPLFTDYLKILYDDDLKFWEDDSRKIFEAHLFQTLTNEFHTNVLDHFATRDIESLKELQIELSQVESKYMVYKKENMFTEFHDKYNETFGDHFKQIIDYLCITLPSHEILSRYKEFPIHPPTVHTLANIEFFKSSSMFETNDDWSNLPLEKLQLQNSVTITDNEPNDEEERSFFDGPFDSYPELNEESNSL